MIKASHKTAILTISEKLDTVQKMRIAKLSEVNQVITDIETNDDKLRHYKSRAPNLIFL